MKKKILGMLVIFTIVGGLVSAQNISGWTETYSETAGKDAAMDAPLTFWGFRQRSEINVDAGRWGGRARYDFFVQSNDDHYAGIYTTGTGDWSCDMRIFQELHTARVWFKPVEGITLTLGNQQDKAIAPSAAFKTAYDRQMGALFGFRGWKTASDVEFWNIKTTHEQNITTGNSVARYAQNGLTLEITAIPNLKLSAHIPVDQRVTRGYYGTKPSDMELVWSVTNRGNHVNNTSPVQTYWAEHDEAIEWTALNNKTVIEYNHDRDFEFKFNAAIEYNIANLIDIAGVYKGGFDKYNSDHAQMGIYAGLNGDMFKAAIGWSGYLNSERDYGIAVGGLLPARTDFTTDTNLSWGGSVTSLVDLAGEIRFNNDMSLALGIEAGLNTVNALPTIVAVNWAWPNLVDTLGLNVRATWENVAYIGGNVYKKSDGNGGIIETTISTNGESVDRSWGKVNLNPEFTYTVGQHQFTAGTNIWCDYYNAALGNGVTNTATKPYSYAYIGFNVPVSYRYYF